MFVTILLSFLLILGVSSYKYLPLAYSIRFFYIPIKYVFLNKNAAKNTSIFKKTIRNSYCCLLECDFFGFHKSNSTYFTELDFARTDCVINVLQVFFKKNNLNFKTMPFMPLCSISNHFLKEMRPFSFYTIETKIVAWDEKWLFLLSCFKINERVYCVSLAKLIFKNNSNKSTISPAEIFKLSDYVFDETTKIDEKRIKNLEKLSNSENNHKKLIELFENC